MGYEIALADINCSKYSFLKGSFLQEDSYMQWNNESGAVETV